MKLIFILLLSMFFNDALANNGEKKQSTGTPCHRSFLLQASHSDQFYYAVFVLQPDFAPTQTAVRTIYIDWEGMGYYKPVHFMSTSLSLSETGSDNASAGLIFIPQLSESDECPNLAVAYWKLSSLQERHCPLPAGFSPSTSLSNPHKVEYAVQYQGKEWYMRYRDEHGIPYIMSKDGIRQLCGSSVCTTTCFEGDPLKNELLKNLPVAANPSHLFSDEAIKKQLELMALIADVVLSFINSNPDLASASLSEEESPLVKVASKKCDVTGFEPASMVESGACSVRNGEPFVAPAEVSFEACLLTEVTQLRMFVAA